MGYSEREKEHIEYTFNFLLQNRSPQWSNQRIPWSATEIKAWSVTWLLAFWNVVRSVCNGHLFWSIWRADRFCRKRANRSDCKQTVSQRFMQTIRTAAYYSVDVFLFGFHRRENRYGVRMRQLLEISSLETVEKGNGERTWEIKSWCPPFEIIEKAVAGEAEAIDTVLRHYIPHIKYLSKYQGHINDEIQDRLKAQLMKAKSYSFNSTTNE